MPPPPARPPSQLALSMPVPRGGCESQGLSKEPGAERVGDGSGTSMPEVWKGIMPPRTCVSTVAERIRSSHFDVSAAGCRQKQAPRHLPMHEWTHILAKGMRHALRCSTTPDCIEMTGRALGHLTVQCAAAWADG